MSSVPRSTFVTAIGGVFTALSALYLVMAIMQNILFALVPMPAEMFSPPAGDPVMPPAAQWMFAHFRELMVANLALSVVSLAVSIGLLMRKEWARRGFIALMAIGIAWNVATLAFQLYVFEHIRSGFAGSGAPEGMGGFFIVMQVVMVLFAGAFCWLFGWIAWRLAKPEVQREFGAA
ncbi:MAG TPA: hypothetical protein VFL14_10455 [Xanthomonadales bacterium]|nr:hypothetical protein [Xanthomonadales bacterium]